MLKATAIVGYIAVQDLTKMGDIIRSRENILKGINTQDPNKVLPDDSAFGLEADRFFTEQLQVVVEKRRKLCYTYDTVYANKKRPDRKIFPIKKEGKTYEL